MSYGVKWYGEKKVRTRRMIMQCTCTCIYWEKFAILVRGLKVVRNEPGVTKFLVENSFQGAAR